MRKTNLLLFALFFSATLLAQASKEDTAEIKKDTAATNPEAARFEKFMSTALYPVIKSSPLAGVLPVQNVTEKPDPTLTYKLLFELTYNNPDSLAKNVSDGLTEVGRIINLHVASGIPLKNIKPVVVVHGPSLYAMMTNESYKKKYKVDNPNFKLIDELRAAGVSFIACGQAMGFRELHDADFPAYIKKSLTAQTVLSSYQMKGYILYGIDEMK